MSKISIMLLGVCLILPILTLACFAESPFNKSTVSIKLLKKINIEGGARPEVVATKDRVFVVYLDTTVKGTAYSVRIYDKDMNREIVHKILVTRSEKYGKPTDIRVASDDKYLYAFYETVIDREMSYLWGAKYTLDDNFERVAYTANYIASDVPEHLAREKGYIGTEYVNDPIVLIGPNSIFVITRIKQKSYSKEEPTIYRVYEFSNDLQKKLSQFDLDLSSVADGQGRQASAYYYNGYYYMVVPTTTGNGDYFESMVTPSDLLLVKLDKNWKIVESNNLSQDHEDVETFVLGFEIHNGLFFVTYKQGMPFVCPLKIYDQNLNLVSSETVKKAVKRESLRSALDVTDDRIYVGLSAGQGPPPPMAKRTAGQDFPQFKRGNQRMQQEGGRFPIGQGFPKDKRLIGNTGRIKAEVYIYELKWWKNR